MARRPATKNATSKPQQANKQQQPAAKTTAVATRPKPKDNLPATPNEYDDMFFRDASAGLENITGADVIIPRLTIVQALSPQLKPRDAAFIEGCKIGDIVDVSMKEIYEEPVLFLPVLFIKQWLEWAPRSSNKSLVAIHATAEALNDCRRDDKGNYINREGNTIQETSQFFGFNLSADQPRRCFIAMAKTQLKHGKRWNGYMTGEQLRSADGTPFTPAAWYRTYELGTVDESNNEGDWKGWSIDRGATLPEYFGKETAFWHSQCLDFLKTLQSGAARGSFEDEAEDILGNDETQSDERM